MRVQRERVIVCPCVTEYLKECVTVCECVCACGDAMDLHVDASRDEFSGQISQRVTPYCVDGFPHQV